MGSVVSSVGSMFGGGGGAGGTGFSAPQAPNFVEGVDASQAADLYKANQAALQQQQNFVNQVMPFGTTGLQNQQQALQGYQDIYAGRGPDLAKAQLQQATQQNIANQAALMAGQRGSSQNTGLLARQAAMQGANTQQQAAGQAAQLRAQQQVNALQGMGGLATQQVNQAGNAQQSMTGAQQNEQQNVLNAISQLNSAKAGVQTGINQANASMANTRMGQQGDMLGGLMGGAASAGKLLGGLFNKGGEVPHYYAGTTQIMPGSGQYDPNFTGLSDDAWNANTASPSIPAPSVDPALPPPAPPGVTQSKATSGFGKVLHSMLNPQSNAPKQESGLHKGASALGSAVGSGIASLFTHSSPQQADEDPSGGLLTQAAQQAEDEESGGLFTGEKNRQDAEAIAAPGQTQEMSASNDDIPRAAHGGKVPAMVSPGEGYLDRKAIKKVEQGASPLKEASVIPGPNKGGTKDTEKNDTVPKDLDEGGIVLPKSVMNAKHPHWEAHKFVSQIMAKNGKLPARKKNG